MMLSAHAGRQGEGLLCGTEGWKTKQALGGGKFPSEKIILNKG